MPRERKKKVQRVLVVAPTPFFADRGCHVRIYEQCRALQRMGRRVTVCTYHLGRDVDDLEIRRSLRVPWYRKLSAGPSVHKFYIDPLLLATVLRECVRNRPDVIHGHLHEGVVVGWVASKLLGIPLVGDLQGSLSGELVQHRFVSEGGLLHGLFTRAERVITRMPDAVVASSAATLASLPGGVSRSERARVVADGVDADAFSFDEEGRQAVRQAMGIDDDTRVIGYLGVLTEYQGVDVLLRSAQRVLRHARPRPRFLIMGYPDVEKYRAMAEGLGIAGHVRFTGRIPYEEARAYLSACDIAVSPKLSQTEANGKLHNYLAVGLPIVASDTAMNREILADAGVLTPPGDEAALAEALMHIANDWQVARGLSRRSLARAAALSRGSMGGELLAVYRAVVGGNTRRSPQKPEHAEMEAVQLP